MAEEQPKSIDPLPQLHTATEEFINALIIRQTQLAERVDEAYRTMAAAVAEHGGMRDRLTILEQWKKSVEERRDISTERLQRVIIPLLAISLSMSLANLGLTVSVVILVANHILNV